ncbi:putative protease [Streptococcus sp. DD10]|uniref:CPBP family intramembrane glutamic endopeptidase n=1 Tax=Streptococcus sp. DD10 TaxID=1777878 RepID=UPI000795C7BF|nr:CPBP family intramembrane glutamic endopeptidase [Streptococcus sp. DD10]KXT74952.1 putative protease [Streptococcus sp. DD10]
MDLKKNAKKELAWSSGNLLLYSILMLVSILLVGIIEIILYKVQHGPGANLEEAKELLSDSMVGYFLAVVVGVLIFTVYKEGRLWTDYICHKGKKMTGKAFIVLLAFLYLGQFSFTLFANLVESLLNLVQLSWLTSIEAASAGSTNWSMFLYAGILGPISEELIFRGTILGSFKTYGKLYALVMSAILFGLFHGNIPQGLFAFLVGLVFGYVALEYSIYWAIFLHIFNNLVIGDVMLWLLGYFPEDIATVISLSLNIIGSGAGLFVLYKNKDRIREYIQENQPEKGVFKTALKSVWFWLFVVSMLFQGLFLITKIS